MNCVNIINGFSLLLRRFVPGQVLIRRNEKLKQGMLQNLIEGANVRDARETIGHDDGVSQ